MAGIKRDEVEQQVEAARADQRDQRVKTWSHRASLIAVELDTVNTTTFREGDLAETRPQARLPKELCALDCFWPHTEIILSLYPLDCMKLICYSPPAMAMLRERLLIDEQTVNLIASQVTAAIKDELETLVTASAPQEAASGMTVNQVAVRLGVARSTVYAHWREWGGYKLGPGAKAPIRFDEGRLPDRGRHDHRGSDLPVPETTHGRGRRWRALIVDSPRMPQAQEEAA